MCLSADIPSHVDRLIEHWNKKKNRNSDCGTMRLSVCVCVCVSEYVCVCVCVGLCACVLHDDDVGLNVLGCRTDILRTYI